jgi:ornithine carbamoyltransferase
MKHLISLHDLKTEEIEQILVLAQELKSQNKKGIPHHILKDKTLGMIFSKPSTRTRVSFEVGMYQLGGHALFLSSNDIQLGRGETIYDTANVLSRYLDGIMIRTFDHNDVEDLAKYSTIPIINGLTDLLHPCQILADLMTIYENKGNLQGLKLAYVGDGNNVLHSLLFGCVKMGMIIYAASPPKYKCNEEIYQTALSDAKATNAKVILTEDPYEAVKDADIIYTDTWVSMGEEERKQEKTKSFAPYQVNKDLFSKAKQDVMFLHCLPAYRGFEVTKDIIDGPNSFVFDEAENRLHAQKAVMALLMNK